MKQLSSYFLIVNMLKLFGGIVHIATGLTPPKSISHMLGHWLTGINKKDRLLIFVGAALIGAIWCTRNDLIFRKNRLPLLCRLFSEKHIGCDFGPYCSLRKGRRSVWQAKR